MRARTIAALGATAGTLALLAGFRTPGTGARSSRVATVGGAAPTTTGLPGPGGAPGGQGAAAGGFGPGGFGPGGGPEGPGGIGDGPGERSPGTTVAGTSDTTAPAGAHGDVYTGQAVPTRFGDVQVAVTLTNGKIVDVKAVALPFDRSRSARISQIAGPILHDEVLQAQSAQIDLVSGATTTSEAYAESLQSALDQIHG
jgi:uncharacterized protein with FMN-binding domain